MEQYPAHVWTFSWLTDKSNLFVISSLIHMGIGFDKTFFALKNEEISVTNFKAQNQHVNPIPFQLHCSQYILLSRTKDHRIWNKNHQRPLTKKYIYMDTKHTKRQTNQIRTTNLKPFYKERMKNKSKTTQKDQVEHKNINLKPSYKKMHKKTKGKTTKKRTQT